MDDSLVRATWSTGKLAGLRTLMNIGDVRQLLLVWVAALSAWTFILFGYDKWKAGLGGRRVTEAALWWTSALGGWPGGLLGILLFRHKSAKGAFLLKFTAAFVVWAALVGGAGYWL